MTAQDLIEWKKRMGFKSRKAAAEALGCGERTLQNYEAGAEIPRYIALACAALERGIKPVGA